MVTGVSGGGRQIELPQDWLTVKGQAPAEGLMTTILRPSNEADNIRIA